MTGPLRERLAVVQCRGQQGSGYLLTPGLVLTAAHLVDGDAEVRVTVPGRAAVRCTVAGSRRGVGSDVALLTSAEPLGPVLDAMSDVWARVSLLGPIPGCQAIGFPYVQRDGAGRLDTEQLTGTYKPGSGLVSGRGVLVLDGAPPAPRADGISPWAGLSGAAVFAGGLLPDRPGVDRRALFDA